MGIGRFYRWLSERYPLINEKIDASSIPAFDNLYLDMNGILHNCSHGNSGGMLHENENLMWQSVFAALDLVISKISPTKLLYLAADGVAPRAKMNQQRARRYRAAKTAAEAAAAEERQRRSQSAASGKVESSSKRERLQGKGFDSNCISPGTEFMAAFFRHLRFFCEKKLNEDPRWRGLKVLLSGPDVPGEGEHKIMAFLRCCKAAGSANPNTRHCLYGLDADLIMLSLASHEPQFALLREEVVFGRQTTVDAANKMLYRPEKLQLLHISLLREYLALDLLPPRVAYSLPNRLPGSQLPKSTSSSAGGDCEEAEDEILLLPALNKQTQQQPQEQLYLCRSNKSLVQASEMERVIDDFVIFCFLAGNDFLPHTFSSDIGEKGLDNMIACYRRFLAEYRFLAAAVTKTTPSDGPWLVGKCGQLNLLNLYIFLKLFVCTVEDPKVESKAADLQWLMQKRGGKELDEEMQLYRSCGDSCEIFRARFYHRKLGISVMTPNGFAELQRLCQSYLEGLQWVAYYYFRGPDGSGWRWFYPFHYAPFMHDVLNCNVFSPNAPDLKTRSATCPTQVEAPARGEAIRDLSYLINRTITLPAGEPYSPFMQLLSILPPQSAELLPEQLRPLLLNPPEELVASFPKDFVIDMEGVKVPWGGVALLPFVDEHTLERIALPLLEKLPPKVLQRNGVGKVVLLMREQHELKETEALQQRWTRGSNVGQRLSDLDSVYQSEFLFFKHKILSKRHDVAIDLIHLQDWLNDKAELHCGTQKQKPRRIFPSSLPYAFPDVLDSCVVEEEVLVLPPPFVARLDEAKALTIIRHLGLDLKQQQTQERHSSRAAADSYVELLMSFLRNGFRSIERRKFDVAQSLPPTPCLHPFDYELLYPTAPLSGICADAAALTPSLYVRCFAWHYGTGVKVFKCESANQSVVLSVMPFKKEQLQKTAQFSVLDLLKPCETLSELLEAPFVLYDFPFVKLAAPVAVWHPTFYFPIDEKDKQKSSEVASQPTQQLQAVEMEKRRLQLQGIAIASESEAFSFFEQQKASIKGQSQQSHAAAPYWDPHLQTLGPIEADSEAEPAKLPPLDRQLHQLASAVTLALPAPRHMQQRRAFHPATALTTTLIELLPVEDIVMEERFAETGLDTGSKKERKNAQPKSTACVHFRYAAETVYRLLPLVSRPSESLVQRVQQCRREVLEAVEAHGNTTWRVGESVICIASSQKQQIMQGVTGVLEEVEGNDGSQLSVRVTSWRSESPSFEKHLQDVCKALCRGTQERVYSLESAGQALGVSPFAAYCIFSTVFLKEADNLYDCGLHVAIFSEESRKPAYVLGFSLPWPRSGSGGAQPSRCMTHLFTQKAVDVARELLEAFPSLGVALDAAGKSSHNLSSRCHLKADTVFAGVGEPAFLASRLSSMAAQSPSRRAKAVPTEYALLSSSLLTNLEAEVAKQLESLPPPASAALSADKSNCARAADLLTIQRHSVSGFLRLASVQHNGTGQYSFTFAVQTQLGQRLAYARFRGSVQQGSRGTACGFASQRGICRIECKWNQHSTYSNAATRAAVGALSVSGCAQFSPIVIQLSPRKRLDLGINGSKNHQHQQRPPLRVQESVTIRTRNEAQRILSQLRGEEKLELLQQQLAHLEDLCVEVLLDEPRLGACDGNGRVNSLRILFAPANHWLPLCDSGPTTCNNNASSFQPKRPGASRHPNSSAVEGRRGEEPTSRGMGPAASLMSASQASLGRDYNPVSNLHQRRNQISSDQQLATMHHQRLHNQSSSANDVPSGRSVSESPKAWVQGCQHTENSELQRSEEAVRTGLGHTHQKEATSPPSKDTRGNELPVVGDSGQQAAATQPCQSQHPQRLALKADALLAVLGVRKACGNPTQEHDRLW